MADSKLKTKANKIQALLDKNYKRSHCTLDHRSALQLLIATILSAQCTDERVNIVTKDLFKKYKKAKDFADAEQAEFEEDIRSTGFYRNKAKNIIACCRKIVDEHGGKVPRTMEELTALPGIGRKTANVILGNCFDTPGMVVDTHVGRVSQRLGLTTNSDPVKIEFDLMKLFPQKTWTNLSHQLVDHGRKVCNARKPKCDECFLAPHCIFVKSKK